MHMRINHIFQNFYIFPTITFQDENRELTENKQEIFLSTFLEQIKLWTLIDPQVKTYRVLENIQIIAVQKAF